MNFVNKIVISIINIYQVTLSPQTGFFRFIYKTPIGSLSYSACPGCRFWPSCSEYSKQAVKKYPIKQALKLSAKRIGRCRNSNGGGVDPLV